MVKVTYCDLCGKMEKEEVTMVSVDYVTNKEVKALFNVGKMDDLCIDCATSFDRLSKENQKLLDALYQNIELEIKVFLQDIAGVE